MLEKCLYTRLLFKALACKATHVKWCPISLIYTDAPSDFKCNFNMTMAQWHRPIFICEEEHKMKNPQPTQKTPKPHRWDKNCAEKRNSGGTLTNLSLSQLLINDLSVKTGLYIAFFHEESGVLGETVDSRPESVNTRYNTNQKIWRSSEKLEVQAGGADLCCRQLDATQTWLQRLH